MGKIAPEPLIPQRTPSGRSYWVRNILAAARDNADTGASAKGVSPSPSNPSPSKQAPTKKRFVEPYRLSAEQRATMLAPLAESGVGDPESRELFAAALAYDLATCYELTVANPDPDQAAGQPLAQPSVESAAPPANQAPARSPGRKAARPAPVDPALAELVQAAQALAARLDALDATARTSLLQGLREVDRFRRGYDDDYLAALRGEVLRVAAGVGAPIGAGTEDRVANPTPPPPSPKKPAIPKPSPAARQFIARAAGAFEECFDRAPTAQVGGPFMAMLKALVAVTGVRIPTDAHNLAELLKQP